MLEQSVQPTFIIHRGLPQQRRLGALGRAAVVRLPAVIGGRKAQAQGIMVLDQGVQGPLQISSVQRLPWFKQDRLVPVVTCRDLLGKEQLVHR